MRTLAILPVKGFGAAKQRLAAALGTGPRRALAQAMFSDVLASLRQVAGLDAVAVVTADPVAEAAARGEGALILRDAAEAGQSAAASIGIAHAEAPDAVEQLQAIVLTSRPQADVKLVTSLGAVVGTHAGPGTVGFFWFQQEG